MKKLLFLSILTIVFTMNSNAQDKASDLKKLFKLMDSEKMIEGMMNNMILALKQQASGQIQENGAKEKHDRFYDE